MSPLRNLFLNGCLNINIVIKYLIKLNWRSHVIKETNSRPGNPGAGRLRRKPRKHEYMCRLVDTLQNYEIENVKTSFVIKVYWKKNNIFGPFSEFKSDNINTSVKRILMSETMIDCE